MPSPTVRLDEVRAVRLVSNCCGKLRHSLMSMPPRRCAAKMERRWNGAGLKHWNALLESGHKPDFLIKSTTCVAGATGLEPATSGVTGRRSNQLSYAPMQGITRT